MPPKKKGKGKKGAKARSPTLVNGLTIDESSKDQLEDHIAQLREELNRERDERNYFQLERDEITSYWKITERELEVAKAELRKLDKDIEEDEERHRLELKVYKQKMKHLLCEHQNAVSDIKANNSVSVEALQKEQEQIDIAIHKKMRNVLVDTQALDIEHLVKDLELKHEEEMAETRNSWERQLLEIKAKYKKKMHFLRTELDNIRKNQTGEREDHCNSHIDALVEDHNRAFNEANLLVNQMQQDVDMNMSLKRQIKDMRMSQKEKEKELLPILEDNKRLAKLLLNVKDQIREKEKKMRNCIPKGSDDHIERVKKKELDDAKAEFQTLEENFRKIQQEREELYKAQSIQVVQQKVDTKIELLERRMKSITDSLERKQTQLCSVLSAPNMDQTALAGVASEIEKNLDASNNTIKSLQYKKSLISKALKDLHLTFEAKQRAIGVPVEELCAVRPSGGSGGAEEASLFLDLPSQNPLSS